MNIYDKGRWDGDVFVFYEPHTLIGPDGTTTIRTINTAGMTLDPGISRDDVIHALLTPLSVTDI